MKFASGVGERLRAFGRRVKARPGRYLLRILYALVGVHLAYLLIVNAGLRTNILRGHLSLPPTEVTLDYKTAYSVFPGRVHVEGVKLRGQDSQIEWQLEVDRADYWLSLTDLAKKLYHASHVRADGVTFRVRLRVDPSAPATAEHFGALPPIEGFPDPPMKNAASIKAGKEPTDLARIWSVQLDDVDALHVRETWIDAIRTAGDMHIRGRWYFRPTQFVDVGPAAIDATNVDVSYGHLPIATGITGAVRVNLSPMEIEAAGSREFLQHITGTVDVKGNAHVMQALQVFLLPPNTEGEGTAPMNLALVFNQGKLANGTRMELAKAPFRASLGPMHLALFSQLSFEVKRDEAGTDTGRARIETSQIKIGYGDTTSKAARATVAATSQTLDFCALPFSRLTLDTEVEDAQLNHHDLEARIAKMSVKSNALAMDYDALTVDGNVDVSATGIKAPLGQESLLGSLSAKVKTKAVKGETNFSGTSIAFDGNMTPKSAPWFARVELTSGVVKASLPHRLRVSATVRAKDVTPATALLSSVSGVPRWLLDAAPLDNLAASGSAHLEGDVVALESVQAKGGSQALQFEYRERGKTTEWLLMADAGPLRVGVHSSRLGVDIKVLDVADWFAKIQKNMRTATPVR